MKMLALTVSLVMSLFAAKSEASVWRVNAAGCVPGDPAIQSNLYLVTGGTVKFKSATGTGTITLYCPVHTLGFSPTWIAMLKYDDSSGSSGSGSVAASYVKMHVVTGVLTTVKTISSDSVSSDSGGTPAGVGGTITDSHDDSTYVYYIRVDITRAAPVSPATLYANEILYQVDLE